FYGQRHAVEMSQRTVLRAQMRAAENAAWTWADGRLVEDHVVDLSGYGAVAESALTADRAIALSDDGLPSTFVPGRNLVFLTVAAAIAYRRGIKVLIGGMCETDYSGYPDCRRETIDAQERTLT